VLNGNTPSFAEIANDEARVASQEEFGEIYAVPQETLCEAKQLLL